MEAPVPISQSKHDKYIIAHAILASVATLITMPLAVLAGRYLRTWKHWNAIHAVLNITTVVLIIASFALSSVAVGEAEYTGADADLHHKLGLAVFVIVLVTGVGGIGAKLLTKAPSFNYVTLNKGRPLLRYLHIILGIATAALLYVQVYTGFDEWDESSESQTEVPSSVTIIFWVLLGIEVAAYVVGWAVMVPLGRRKRRRELESETVMMDKAYRA